jgi:hypothetical protein
MAGYYQEEIFKGLDLETCHGQKWGFPFLAGAT